MAYDYVSPGKPLAIRADDWNGAMRAARMVDGGELTRTRGLLTPSRNSELIRNDSEVDLPRFSILGIRGVVITDEDNLAEFQSRVVLRGGIPDEDYDLGKFAVITEPLKAGKIGPCVAMGLVQAIVDIEVGDFADIADGDTSYLKRGESGARVLYTSFGPVLDAEGEPIMNRRWAVIAVGGGGGGGDCACDEVHELRIDGAPTGGTIPVTYSGGSAAAIPWNCTAATAQSLLEASNAALVGNIGVYEGPLPIAALYIRFGGDLEKTYVSLPTVTNSLTGGTNPSPKVGHFTTPGFPV